MQGITLRQKLEGMALAYNPKVAPDLSFQLAFAVSGDEPGDYYISVDKGLARFHIGRAPAPTTTIKTPAQVWRKISGGELDGAQAMMSGQYTVEGDTSLMMRMGELFIPADQLELEVKRRPPGPLPIGGAAYLYLTIFSWIFHLFTFGAPIADKSISYGGAAAIAVAVTLYRLVFNRPTVMEAGTAIYFIVMLLVFESNKAFLLEWGGTLSLSVMSFLWLIDMALGRIPLAANYSKWHFIPAMESHSGFLYTNFMISLVWGSAILLQVALRVFGTVYPQYHGPMLAAELSVLVPAVIFTIQYPKKAAERRIEDPEASMRLFRTLALVLIAGLVCLLAIGIGVGSG